MESMESGIHGCGIRSPQTWNPESTDVESRIHRHGIRNPGLSWFTLHGANPRIPWRDLSVANNHDNFMRVISVLSVNCVKRALDQRTRMQMSTSFIRERFGTLFSSLSSSSRNLLLKIENRKFHPLYPVFFFYFHVFMKKKIMTAIMLCMHETLNKDLFYELEVQNSPL